MKEFLSRNQADTIMVAMKALEREMAAATPITRREQEDRREVLGIAWEHQHAPAALTKDTQKQAMGIRTVMDQIIGQGEDMSGEELLLGIKTLWILGAVGREVKVESHLQK